MSYEFHCIQGFGFTQYQKSDLSHFRDTLNISKVVGSILLLTAIGFRMAAMRTTMYKALVGDLV